MNRQNGVALLLSLIALVIMSLAAVALVRTTNLGTLVTGNVSFKHSATNAGDNGIATAITWLDGAQASSTCDSNSKPTTYCDHAGSGYYANYIANLDPTGNVTGANNRILVDWNGDNCAYAASGTFASCISPKSAGTVDGNTVSYIITRLCKLNGDPNSSGCRNSLSSGTSGPAKRGELKYGENKRFTGISTPFYRIIVHVRGARNTVSIVESTVRY